MNLNSIFQQRIRQEQQFRCCAVILGAVNTISFNYIYVNLVSQVHLVSNSPQFSNEPFTSNQSSTSIATSFDINNLHTLSVGSNITGRNHHAYSVLRSRQQWCSAQHITINILYPRNEHSESSRISQWRTSSVHSSKSRDSIFPQRQQNAMHDCSSPRVRLQWRNHQQTWVSFRRRILKLTSQ